MVGKLNIYQRNSWHNGWDVDYLVFVQHADKEEVCVYCQGKLRPWKGCGEIEDEELLFAVRHAIAEKFG